jgi:hypothetical protein
MVATRLPYDGAIRCDGRRWLLGKFRKEARGVVLAPILTERCQPPCSASVLLTHHTNDLFYITEISRSCSVGSKNGTRTDAVGHFVGPSQVSEAQHTRRPA